MNADAMTDAKHWIVDETFKSASNLFYQLFTIHGLFPDSWHLPLFYGLLPGKTTTLYQNLFEELDTWGPYQTQSILMDYELAKWIRFDQQIQRILDNYDEYTSILDFLRAVGCLTMR